MEIRPQKGPQEAFLSTPADVAFYGGSAGGGKSFALLMEPLRHIGNPQFSAVIFRRTSPQITNPGGLWDESTNLYSVVGATPRKDTYQWTFNGGAKVKFAHMQHEKDRLSWQGAQIPLIGFDELTHFEWRQFIYMLSRNRSTCGVKPYIRGTCNPDPESWVKDFIEWWLDDDGYAIKERSGVIRWFVVVSDEIRWFDSREEAITSHPDLMPKSFTFIHSSIYDNRILMEADPGYLANLQALPYIERMQLLEGNWKINVSDGIVKREWLRYYRELPNVEYYVWSWDTAIKTGQENDYSAGLLWAACQDGYYLVDCFHEKLEYPELKRAVEMLYNKRPASKVLIEDKSSGQQLVQDFRRTSRMPVFGVMPGKEIPLDKVTRLQTMSTLFEAGKIFLPHDAPWLADYVHELCGFPNAKHDDLVDASTLFGCTIVHSREPNIRVVEF